MASLPPHSATRGVRVSAQAAITRFAVAVEPVNAILSTPDEHRSAPVFPSPVMVCRTGCPGAAMFHSRANSTPTPGESSLGLKTTALPAASA